MRLFFLFFLGILLFPIAAQAQNFQVKGVVKDSISGEALANSSIAFIPMRDSSGIQGTASDLNGIFSFDLKQGMYRMQVSYTGFKTYVRPLRVQSDIDLGTILLSENILTEVQVQGQVTSSVLKGDTLEMNANAYKTNPDATAENLVEKMPGITIQNGKVQAQGEDVKQVLVDGKPFFGNDPNATMKNLPAEMIDKVQVYDQASEQSRFSGFDDGNTSKTINFITKPEFRSGTFGRVYAGGGYDDEFKPGGERYKAGGVLNSFKENRRITVLGQFNNINEQNFSSDDLAGVMSGSGGGMGGGRGGMSGGGGRGSWGGGNSNIGQFLVNDQGGITSTNAFGVNYSDKWGKKIDFSSAYFFNYTDNLNTSFSDQNYINNSDSGLVYSEIENTRSKNMNHRANFRLEYKIDEKNNLVVAPRFSLQWNEGQSSLNSETNKLLSLLNQSNREFNSKSFAWTLNNAITYSHSFQKKGRSLTINLNNDHKNSEGNSILQSVNNSAFLNDTLDINSNLDQFETTLSTRFEYAEPLGEKSQLQFIYNPSYSFNDADKKTFSYNSVSESYEQLDTFLSIFSTNNYHIQNAGLGWRYNDENLNVQVRAQFQWSSLFVDQTYPNIFTNRYQFYNVLPFASLRYKISKTKNIRAFYRSSTNVPTINQLQEVVNNSNPVQLIYGNASLQQETSHRFNIHYTAPNPEKNTTLFTMISLSYTDQFIGSNNFIASSDTSVYGVFLSRGSQITRPENLPNRISISSFSTFGFPIKLLKSNLNLNLNLIYNRTPSKINDNLNYAQTPNASFGLTFSSNISTKLDFTLSSNTSLNASFNSLNASLNSQFLNQNSKFRLYWNPWKSLVFRTDLSHQYYFGLNDGFTQNFLLWNASIAMKIFKNQQGEIAFTVFDILGQNNSISRNFTETYIETNITNLLQRYFMLQFTYKFKPKKGEMQMDKEKEELERYQMYRNYRGGQ